MTTMLLCLLCQSSALGLLGLVALRLTRRFGPSVQTLVGRAALVSVALLALLLPLSGHIQPVIKVEPTPSPVTIRSNAKHTLPKREGAEEDMGAKIVGVPVAAPSDRAGDIPAPADTAQARCAVT